MAVFVTLNVNGIRDSHKRAGLVQWLSHLSADFVCLQETHITSAEETTRWFSSFGFSSVTSPGSSHSCGSVILYLPKYTLCDSWKDDQGRFVMAEFKYHGILFRIVCLYAPNRNPARDDFFLDVIDRIDPSVPTVFGGDFNAVFNRAMDRRGSSSDSSRESCRSLAFLFRECCILDIWRSLHPDLSVFTWTSPDGSRASRIDLLGCPFSWVHSVSSSVIVPCPFSDHSAVVLNVIIPEPFSRGPGRWTLNKSALRQDSFITLISSFWVEWRRRKSSFHSLQQWWDEGKK